MTTPNVPAIIGRQNLLPLKISHNAAQVVGMPVPRISSIQPLANAVVLIARAAGGAGADTLTALIEDQARRVQMPTTIVDFTMLDDEGPAWQRNPTETKQIKLEINDKLGAELGNIIAEQNSDLIIVNAPANSLPDFRKAEADFGDIINAMGRRYYIFWIDTPHDEASDRLNKYIATHGIGKCIVFAIEAEEGRPTKRNTSIEMPASCSTVITIPRLNTTVAEAFYKDRLLLQWAFEQGRAGTRIAFHRRLAAMMTALGEVL